MTRTPTLAAAALALLATAGAHAADSLDIGRFSSGTVPADWQEKSFAGHTRYTPGRLDGRAGLHAESRAAASGLYREIHVDLARTPLLVWDWRVEALPENGPDERTKAGDDFAARVYVVISGGLAFWKTRTLVYVWAAREPVGAHWDNPFTANAKMRVLRSGLHDAHRWVTERRDLGADLRDAFGEDIPAIDAVAIMTDTDNSGLAANAWYGDIRMLSRE